MNVNPRALKQRSLMVGFGWALLAFSFLHAQDVFFTRKGVPPTPAQPLIGNRFVPVGNPGQPLLLSEAIDRGLAHNPKTREEWANIEAAAAQVGIAYSAYLPTLQGTGSGDRQVSTTKVTNSPLLNSDEWANTDTGSLSFSWVLYDFGGRHGTLKNAKALLLAAQATNESTLRDVFTAVVKDYFNAQSRQGTVETDRVNEATAKQSLFVATQRVNEGVAPVTDEFQAKTAYLQAKIDRTKTEGDLRIAVGTLAVDLGLRPDQPLILPHIDDSFQESISQSSSVSQLIEDAFRQHPTVRAAQAKLDAAVAKVAQIRAQLFPILSLQSKYSRSDQPLNAEVGVSPFKAVQTEGYIGIQLSFPLFDGFSTDYQIRQAKAQVEVQRQQLEEAKEQVGLDVWTTYQSFKEAETNLQNNADFLDVAQKSFRASQARYQHGVGSMIEQLSAQSTLASAKLQWIQALVDFRSSRLELDSKLGTLSPTWLARRR